MIAGSSRAPGGGGSKAARENLQHYVLGHRQRLFRRHADRLDGFFSTHPGQGARSPMLSVPIGCRRLLGSAPRFVGRWLVVHLQFSAEAGQDLTQKVQTDTTASMTVQIGIAHYTYSREQ